MNHPPFHRGVSETGISELIKLKEHQESGAKPPAKKMNNLYKKELALAFLLLTTALRSLLSAQGVEAKDPRPGHDSPIPYQSSLSILCLFRCASVLRSFPLLLLRSEIGGVLH